MTERGKSIKASGPTPPRSLRILGIDPGSVRTGYGIIERSGTRTTLITAGTIVAGDKRPLEERMLSIHRGLTDVIAEHRPAAAAVEDIFMAKYANAALKLGHARGVALLAVAQAGLAVHAYPPSLVKRSVIGKGRADKAQVARIVGVILNLQEPLGPDATDALAIALTHAQAHHVGSAAAIMQNARTGARKFTGRPRRKGSGTRDP